MKVLAINGSPRKQWNTATLLTSALKGAASNGAQTELVHLYDLNFKGCITCNECKLKNGLSFGKCAYNDELSPLLAKIETIDAIILGAPIFLGTIPGVVKSFLERLATPYLIFSSEGELVSLFPRKIPAAFIHTMGGDEEHAKAVGVLDHIRMNEMMLKMVFGSVEGLVAADTLHFEDYSKYVTPFDAEEKLRHHKEIFPLDCERAFEIGARLIESKRPANE